MKKNIGFAGLDSTLAKWIYEKLRLAAPDTGNVDELMEGVERPDKWKSQYADVRVDR